jgi:hypothetical protein
MRIRARRHFPLILHHKFTGNSSHAKARTAADSQLWISPDAQPTLAWTALNGMVGADYRQFVREGNAGWS